MNSLTNIILAGVCFGIWPLLMGKSSNANPIVQIMFVAFFSMVIAILLFSQNFEKNVENAVLSISYAAIIAGLLNGVGWFFMLRGLNMTAQVAADKTIVIMVMTQLCVNLLLGTFWLHSPITWQKVIGCIGAGIAILFLV